MVVAALVVEKAVKVRKLIEGRNLSSFGLHAYTEWFGIHPLGSDYSCVDCQQMLTLDRPWWDGISSR